MFGLIIKVCGQLLIASFILVFLLIQFIDLPASILVFSKPICLICGRFIALACNDAWMITLLPLMGIPSGIVRWS